MLTNLDILDILILKNIIILIATSKNNAYQIYIKQRTVYLKNFIHFYWKIFRFYGYIINLQEPFCYNHICMLQDIAQDLKAPDKESLSIEISTEPKFGISLISFYA